MARSRWRARSRPGERRYRVLTNNCEHFCEWCLRGRSRSAQVESLRISLRAWPPAVLRRLVELPQRAPRQLRALAPQSDAA